MVQSAEVTKSDPKKSDIKSGNYKFKTTLKNDEVKKSKMQLPTTTASSASVSQPSTVTSTVSGKLKKIHLQCTWYYLVNSSRENGQF